jgi:hypothetical protein
VEVDEAQISLDTILNLELPRVGGSIFNKLPGSRKMGSWISS